LTARFGSEYNFALHAGHGYGCYYSLLNSNMFGGPSMGALVPHVGASLHDSYLGSLGDIANTTGIAMTLEYRGMRIEMRWERPATLWRAPVETIVYALEGFERRYQSSCPST